MPEKRKPGLIDWSIFCMTGVALYFFLRRSSLFGPSLFILLLSVTFLLRFPVSLWLFNLILAIVVYLAVYLFYPPIRENARWLTPGRMSLEAVLSVAGVVGLSAGALGLWTGGGLWARGYGPGFSSLAGALPSLPNPFLLAAGITGFALLNGIGEEITFRGIYWDGLASLFGNPVTVVLIQALFFGLCHFRGFPSGPPPAYRRPCPHRRGDRDKRPETGPLTTLCNLIN